MTRSLQDRLLEVNKELWLLLSLFVITAILNFLISSNRVLLGLYTVPTLYSAYNYGRRHAIMTAVATLFLVILLALLNPNLFLQQAAELVVGQKWFDIMAWGGILIVTAYIMGTLQEHKERNLIELRQTYHGVLMILCHFVSKDKYTQNHSYRVSVYATRIAAELGLNSNRIEDIRAASLLHDIGKMEVSRDILYKAARLTREEYAEVSLHVDKGGALLEPVGGSLSRIIPIILAHHDKFDGSGQHPASGNDIPLEARIISVADVYDALTSDRPYRKAMSPYEAKDTIVNGSGTEFDPVIVDGFVAAFRKNELEIPEVMV
jgi:HD-GYP domain-containing protein (c-di-GMP phosphodiesterase class II)